MLEQMLLELLGMAPSLVADVEGTIARLHASPDAAAKAQAVSDGLAHLTSNLQPLLSQVGK